MSNMQIVRLGKCASSVLEEAPELKFSEHTFSGGEVHMTLDEGQEVGTDVSVLVTGSANCDVMKIIQIADILKRNGAYHLILVLPYHYYSRQDRATTKNSSHALKLFTEAVAPHYDVLVTYDMHSYIAEEFNEWDTDCCQLAETAPAAHLGFCLGKRQPDIICAPDAGACIKIHDLVNNIPEAYHALTPVVIEASKKRDPKTGALSDPEVLSGEDLTGKHVLIFDDICDGGYTFIQLAKVLRARGVTKIGLAVSHGIFSKGVDELNKYFDYIETTDSCYTGSSETFKIGTF